MSFRLFELLVLVLLAASRSACATSSETPTIADREHTLSVAAKDDDLPKSKDELFSTEPEPVKGESEKHDGQEALPVSKDELFGVEPPPEKSALPSETLPAGKDDLFAVEAPTTQPRPADFPINGHFQEEVARTYAAPAHWSKILSRMEIGSHGRLGQGVQWTVSGRLDYNAVYDLTDYYQPQVRDAQRKEFQLRDTYLDFSAGSLDWRVGRQQIVWGEMVGLFFADVVSAKDMREFVVRDFDGLRIPQWAARAEYFKDDFHAEVVWIPLPSYDKLGKPQDFFSPASGSDFYPYPPSALPPIILDEEKPSSSIDHGNFGIRVSQLTQGWDLSGFFYTSMNSAPTFYRTGVNTFTPRHDRIWQMGGTLAKDFNSFVLKAETVYSDGRKYNLRNTPTDPDGVVEQNTLDWVIGLDFNPTSDIRVNTQLFERYFFNHVSDIVPDRSENGATLLVNYKLPRHWDVEALLVRSLNRDDWMFRPKAAWGFQPNWKLTLGLDVFHGPYDGLFGQYTHNDRGYAEIRYDF